MKVMNKKDSDVVSLWVLIENIVDDVALSLLFPSFLRHSLLLFVSHFLHLDFHHLITLEMHDRFFNLWIDEIVNFLDLDQLIRQQVLLPFIEFSLVRIASFGLPNERNDIRHKVSVARIVNESFLDEQHVLFGHQLLQIVVFWNLRKENAMMVFFNFKRNSLVEVDLHVCLALLDFHSFKLLGFGVFRRMGWLDFLIKEHVSVARLGITSSKALALDNLRQVDFSNCPVIKLVPLSLPVDVRIVMACFCWPRVNQDSAKHVQVRILSTNLLFFILINFYFFFESLTFYPLFRGFVLEEFTEWKLSQVEFFSEFEVIVEFFSYHVFHIKLKSLQCENQYLWEVLDERSLHHGSLFAEFLA